MEKRVLLAVSLSFLVLLAYQMFVMEPLPPESSTPAPAGPAAPAPERSPHPAAPHPSETPAVEAASPAQAPAPVADADVRDIVVESARIRAVFSNRGAVLRSYRLKDYTDPDGSPIDLVPQDLPPADGRPFALAIENDPALAESLNGAVYRASAEALDVSPTGGTLEFTYRAAGVDAVKSFRFDPARPYVIDVQARVTRGGQPIDAAIRWGPALGDNDADVRSAQPSQAIYSADGDTTRVAWADLAEEQPPQGRFDFIGVDDHYFLSAALSEAPVRVHYEAVELPALPGAENPRRLVSYRVQPVQPVERQTFFFGPKDFDVLQSAHPELVRAIHFGWFAALVVPLLRSLKWINGFVGNYGWSIILLTVFINLLIFPLRHKSVVSMRKMQEIQPEVKAIQDRYAKLKLNDPARQKMNVEVMNLYRERGVNPASGCVPMLLTMPILFAFYSMLSVAIELRGAPFAGWIHDLSTHDPYYVTPLLMGATMVWQQRITPTTADPMQQKMFMLMPIVFTFMFLWVPSGLVIYWFVSNLLAIGQTYVTNHLVGPPAPVRRPAPEPKIKRVGGGRTDHAAGK